MYILFVGTFLLATAIAFIISLIVTPLAIRLAPKIGAVDIPKDNRRMHTKAMPRFGGLAIFTGTMCAMVLAQYVFLPYLADTWTIYWEVGGLVEPVDKITGILIGGCLIYIVGVVDDLRGMPAKVKFLCQILCAAVVYGFGVRIDFLTNHFGDFFGNGHTYLNTIIGCVATIIWIVGITNTINLIDGLDGLAAGVAAIASFAIGYTAYIHGMYTATIVVLAVAGGALGFLPYNFHPAKIFMGDSGSLFLGFMLASASIIGPVKSATVLATAVPVLVLGVPIFDTAFAILRRIVNKRPIMEADKGHLHHRLMAAGLGQTRSVLMLYGISGVMGVAAILFSRDYFLECFALFALAANFIYIFLVDAQTPFLQIRGARKAGKDAEGVPAEAVAGGRGEGEAGAENGCASEQQEPEEEYQSDEREEIQHDNKEDIEGHMKEQEPVDVSEEEANEKMDEEVEAPQAGEEMQEDAGEKI